MKFYLKICYLISNAIKFSNYGDVIRVFCKNELEEYGLISYSEGSFWLSYFNEPAKQHLSDFKKYDSENTGLLITGLRSF